MFSKSRMDTFTDAVMAIVLTMMSLSIPTTFIDGHLDVRAFVLMIGIYLVSFCFVASIWYQRSIVFSNVGSTLNQKTVFYDLVLLFFLSLTPIMTKLMIEQIDSTTVSLYGLLIIIIFAIIYVLRISILKDSLLNEVIDNDIYLRVRKRQRIKYLSLDGSLTTLIIIGLFVPILSFVLYMIVIVATFLMFRKSNFVDGYSSLIHAYKDFERLSEEENRKLSDMFDIYVQAKKEKRHDRSMMELNRIILLFENKFNIDKKEAQSWVKIYRI